MPSNRPTPTKTELDAHLPSALRIGAAVSWRLLIMIATIAVLAWGIGYLAVVTIPVAIAMLLTALFTPLVSALTRWKLPRALSTAIAVVMGLGVIGGVLTLFFMTFSTGIPELRSQVSASIDQIRHWLSTGPLHLTQDQLQHFLDSVGKAIRGNQSLLTSGALNTAATVGEGLTGVLLCLFTLIFFLHDGRGIWTFLIKLVPQHSRSNVDLAGRRGFGSLVSYVRATVVVAIVDALGIGVGLLIVGVPLVVPLSALVFLGAFVPIVGAVVTGVVAVLVAMVAKGFVTALIVLAIVVAVMQVESHVLQPLLLGRAVKLHPLSVVLGVAAGVVIAGIAGALLAVPLLAVVNAGARSMLSDVRARAYDESQPQPTDLIAKGGPDVELSQD